MSAAVSIVELDDEILMCKICYDRFSSKVEECWDSQTSNAPSSNKDPRLLACSHTYCKECLVHLSISTEGKSIVCPSCREVTTLDNRKRGVEDLKINFLVQDLVEYVKSIEAKHVAKRRSDNDSNDPLKTEDSFSQETKACLQHSESNMSLYCKSCHMCICITCISDGHSGHRIMAISDVLGKAKEEIHLIHSSLQEFTDKIDKQIATVEVLYSDHDATVAKFHSLIDEAVAKAVSDCKLVPPLIQTIENHRDECHDKLSDASRFSHKRLQDMQSSLRSSKEVVQKALDSIVGILSDAFSSTEVIRYVPTAKAHFKDMERCMRQISSVQSGDISVTGGEVVNSLETIVRGILCIQQGEGQIGRSSLSSPSLPLERAEGVIGEGEGSGLGQMDWPQGLLIHRQSSSGRTVVFVAEAWNNRVQVFDACTGQHMRFLGSVDESGVGDDLNAPAGLAIMNNGFGDALLFVADSENGAIQVFSVLTGDCVYTIGEGSPNANKVVLQKPTGLAILLNAQVSDQVVNLLYIADEDSHKVRVVRAENGELFRSIGDRGSDVGQLNGPQGVAVYSPLDEGEEKLLFVADSGNKRVQVFNAISGAFIRSISIHIQEPIGVSVFYSPESSQGERVLLFVADSGSHRIHAYDAMTGDHLRSLGSRGSGRQQCDSPRFLSACTGANGNILLFVTDRNNHRVQVMAVDL